MKIEVCLPQKPEVIRIGRTLGIPSEAVCGWLIKFWGWVGANSVDGVVDGVVDADVDMVMPLPGFAAALVAVGWLQFDADGRRLIVPNFARHNGESSKKRALKASRQARWRDANVDAVVDAPVDAPVAQKVLPEKRREELNTSALPEWIPTGAWQAYLEMRKKLRKPPTDRASQLVIAELLKLKNQGHSPIAVLEQSIRNSWQDVYPLRGGPAKTTSLIGRAAI